MNLIVALFGISAGAVVAVGLRWTQARSDRRSAHVTAHGVDAAGRVIAAEATGRYAAFRRVTVETDGGYRFIQTFSQLEAGQLGLEVGSSVPVRYVPSEPGVGHVRQAPSSARTLDVAVWSGVFIAVLGLIAAVVVDS